MATARKDLRRGGGRPRELPRTKMGQAIERLAGERGLHLDQVAEKAGIRGPTLYRILTGRIESPRASTVLALAKALRVPVGDLVN
jgi:transcriptional regulator with XRE-family HTH domain